MMKAYRHRSGKPPENICSSVFIAVSFFRKFSGLLFRKPLKDDEIFALKDCKSIHTIGMSYRLDIIFLDDSGKIVAIFEDLAPCRITPYIREAVLALEAKSGLIKKRSLALGDRIILE